MKFSCMLLALFLLVSLQAKEGVARPKVPLKPPENAGKPENGLQLELDVPEEWYVLGDQIQIPLSFKNVSTTDLSTLIDPCCSFYDHVFMTDEQGIPCDSDQERGRDKHLSAQWLEIPAGGETTRVQSLPHWVQIKKPGTYTLWFEFVQKAERAEQLKNWRKPKGTPWSGTLVSNAVKITILSQEEYFARASGPLKTGPCDGLGLKLSTGKNICTLGEAPQFKIELKNHETQALQVPWLRNYRVFRINADGAAIPVHEFMWPDPKDPDPRIAIGVGETVPLELKLRDDHIHNALIGPTRYRVDFWLAAPAVIESGAAPAAPMRTVSNEIVITYTITETDFEAMLPKAAAEVQAGARQHNAKTLTVLCSYLDTIAPWLAARVKNEQTPEQKLAADLLLASKLKQLLPAHRGWNPSDGIYLDAAGARLEPQNVAALAQLEQPVADMENFAARCVRLYYCCGLAGSGMDLTLNVAPEASVGTLQDLALAIEQQAKARNVYIRQLTIYMDNRRRSVNLQNDQSYSLLIGVRVVDNKLRYSVVPYPMLDERPNYYRGWKTEELPAAAAELQTTPNQFDSSTALAKFLAARPKRHEQVWLLPEPEVTWHDINGALSALRSWQELGVSLATKLPNAPNDAPKVKKPVDPKKPVPPPTAPDDF